MAKLSLRMGPQIAWKTHCSLFFVVLCFFTWQIVWSPWKLSYVPVVWYVEPGCDSVHHAVWLPALLLRDAQPTDHHRDATEDSIWGVWLPGRRVVSCVRQCQTGGQEVMFETTWQLWVLLYKLICIPTVKIMLTFPLFYLFFSFGPKNIEKKWNSLKICWVADIF